MKLLFGSALALSLAALSPVFAQTPAGYAPPPQVSEEELNAALEKFDGSSVLATVGDRKVTLADAAMIYDTLPQDVATVPAEQLLAGITEQLVSETALYEMALEAGLQDKAAMKFRLAALERSAMAEAYLTEELRVRVTDERLRAIYDERVKELPSEEEVSARHILVETEEEAIAIAKEARDGADFAELAAEKSTGPSGPTGGDLGFFLKGEMVEPFANTAFDMKPGDISDPVQTQFGWHVILVEDRRMREPPPFEAVETQIRAEASRSIAQEIIDEVRKARKIDIVEETPPAFLIREPRVYQE